MIEDVDDESATGSLEEPTMTALLSSPLSEPISLGRIEHELTRQLGVVQKPGEAPVRRARMSNLVIFCNNEDQAKNIHETIPQIVAHHPARAAADRRLR